MALRSIDDITASWAVLQTYWYYLPGTRQAYFGATVEAGLRAGRAPKKPEPIRTIVAPSCTATSRSSVMPIEHWPRDKSSTTARNRATPGRAASDPALEPTAMRPATDSPASWQWATSVAVFSGRQPPLVRSPVTLTCTMTAAPGA